MPSFNKIIVCGHCGRDPELTYTPQGTAVCKITVATTEKRKDKEPVTTWFRVTFWGKQAEVANQYLHKGSLVYVEGRLTLSEYTDKEGGARASLEVNATELQLMGERAQAEGA